MTNAAKKISLFAALLFEMVTIITNNILVENLHAMHYECSFVSVCMLNDKRE